MEEKADVKRLLTHHPVWPLSLGHVAHPQVDQMFNPHAAWVLRKVHQVEVKGEVAFFHLRGAIVHHGLLHLVVIIRLCHHEPGEEQELVFEDMQSDPPPH